MTAFCMDWSCPARVSCARHFGRSKQYWHMRGKSERKDGPRDDGADSCPEYVLDKPRSWIEP